jgi:hypothetical protein
MHPYYFYCQMRAANVLSSVNKILHDYVRKFFFFKYLFDSFVRFVSLFCIS